MCLRPPVKKATAPRPPSSPTAPKPLCCHSSLPQFLLNSETQLCARGAAYVSGVCGCAGSPWQLGRYLAWLGPPWLGWVFHGQTTSPAAGHPDCWHTSAMQNIIHFASTMLHFSICATKFLKSSRKKIKATACLFLAK